VMAMRELIEKTGVYPVRLGPKARRQSFRLSWRVFFCCLSAVLAFFGGLIPASAVGGESPQARLAKAEAMFQERCKTAGEKIYRTAENVEGIFLMKLRTIRNFSNQFALDDPYGNDSTRDEYIKSFLYGRNSKGSLAQPGSATQSGFRYVEAIDQKDGKRYRYTGSMRVVGKKDPNTPNHQVELRRNPHFDLNNYAFVLDRTPAASAAARYGLTYDDISMREEREYWIAGSSLKVIDLKTNEVIAERIGYMMDREQGNTSGGRSPWLLAANNSCPSFRPSVARSGAPGFSYQVGQTRNFVEKVLTPLQER
jgi:hypothetical protein